MLFRRSLLQELISATVGAFLILLGVVIAQRAGYLIRLAAKGVLPNDALGTMLVFNIIKFLPMLLSLALFLSILMTLSRWYRDSEMIIWFSAGLSFNSWVRPTMAFAMPIILLISILSIWTMPWATKKGEDYAAQLESRDELAAISPGVFKESANAERVFFIESYDALGNIVKNIFVRSMQDNKLSIVVAEQGNRFMEKNGDNFLIMKNGRRYLGTPSTADFSTTEFEKYAVRVQAAEVKQKVTKTISKSSKELFQDNSNANNAELQWRIAIPISALVLALLAIPLSALDPRAGRSGNFALALVIYMIYINALSISHSLVAQGKVQSIIGLWPVHIGFSILVIYIFHRRTQQKPILPKILSFN